MDNPIKKQTLFFFDREIKTTPNKE